MNEELEQQGDVEDITGEAGGFDGDAGMGDGKPKANKGLMIALGVVVVIGGFYMVKKQLGGGPQGAAAATGTAGAPGGDAQAAIAKFLSDGPRNMQAMHDLLRNTEKVVQQFDAFPSAAQVPLSDLKTNPFRFEAEKPKAERRENLEEQERKRVLAAVQQLKLQSVMHGGARPVCMISDKDYAEGATIGILTIERINRSSVVVRGGQWRYELKIKE